MKQVIMLMVFAAITIGVNAQTTDGTKAGASQKRTTVSKKEKKRLKRGTGQYYGNKDTTPGSPMGTGGAGGGDMSGSQEGSALESSDQADSTAAASDSSNAGNENSGASGANKTSK